MEYMMIWRRLNRAKFGLSPQTVHDRMRSLFLETCVTSALRSWGSWSTPLQMTNMWSMKKSWEETIRRWDAACWEARWSWDYVGLEWDCVERQITSWSSWLKSCIFFNSRRLWNFALAIKQTQIKSSRDTLYRWCYVSFFRGILDSKCAQVKKCVKTCIFVAKQHWIISQWPQIASKSKLLGHPIMSESNVRIKNSWGLRPAFLQKNTASSCSKC